MYILLKDVGQALGLMVVDYGLSLGNNRGIRIILMLLGKSYSNRVLIYQYLMMLIKPIAISD